MSLLDQSWRSLRHRFEVAGDRTGTQFCVMVERTGKTTRPQSIGFPEGFSVPPTLSVESSGMSMYTAPRVEDNVVVPGRMRGWRCFGKSADAWHAFSAIARDAGRLLRSTDTASLDAAAETRAVEGDVKRWLWTLFDLAWHPLDGSPLIATKMAWEQLVSIPLDEVSGLREHYRQPTPLFSGMQEQKIQDPVEGALTVIPDPPDAFYSIIEDLFSASCQAIDRLLVASVHPEGGLSESLGDARSTGDNRTDGPLNGEWSLPMSKKDMMSRLNLSSRAFGTFASEYGLNRISRQQWQIRLDRMDSRTRAILEAVPPSK